MTTSGDGKAPGTREPDPNATSPVEPRVRGAWQAWLSSLATDANAATAAAHLYAELPADARDAWLAAVAEDAPDLEVPVAAIYGPLLAVEADPTRLDRISRAANTRLGPITEVKRALLGTGPGGVRLAVLVIPLYLDFVRVLLCRIVKDRGFEWVRQEPIVREGDAPEKGSVLDGIKLYASSRDAVVDELAHAVLAHRRQGRELPQLLVDCADLFSAALVSSEAR
jgi:hypothetical protein